MAVFHCGDDDIECGEAFFEFDPGQTSATGLVGAGGVFDQEALVSGGADVAEVGVDFLCAGCVEDFRMAKGGRKGEGTQELAAVVEGFLQQAGAVELKDVENNAGDGDFIFKKEVGLQAAKALLERMKRQGASVAPCQNLGIENDLAAQGRHRPGNLGKGACDQLEVAGENLCALCVCVDLSPYAVELRLDPEHGGIGKAGLNGGGIRFGRGQHALYRLKEPHRPLVQAAFTRHECHQSQVRAEHVRLAHLGGISLVGLGDAFLQQALLEADAQVAGEDLHKKLCRNGWCGLKETRQDIDLCDSRGG